MRNENIYRNRDASVELVDWIDDNGGSAGICGRKKEEIEEYSYDYKEAGNKPKKKKNNTEQKQKQQLEVLELKKLAIAERTGFQCSIFLEEDPTFTVLKCVCAVQQKKG